MASEWKPKVRVYDSKVKDFVSVTLAVEINWNAIAVLLAQQAIRNKSRKATQLHKALKAEIIKQD